MPSAQRAKQTTTSALSLVHVHFPPVLLSLFRTRGRSCASTKMAARIWMLFVLLGSVFCKDKEDDSCRTYAGGQVYPQEVKTGHDHALHWSKALSEYGSAVS